MTANSDWSPDPNIPKKNEHFQFQIFVLFTVTLTVEELTENSLFHKDE